MKKPSSVSAAETLTDATEIVAEYAIDGLEGERLTEGEAEPRRVGAWFIFVYMLTYFGLNLTMLLPALFSIAYKVQLIDPVGKETSLGLILGVGGIFGLVAGPIFGVLSDGTRFRWGRRRPWLAGGILLAAAGAFIIALAPNTFVMFAGYAVSQLAIAAVSAGFNPVLAERVPSVQRGKVGALGGISAALAGVGAFTVGGMLTGNLLLLFLLPVLVFAGATVLFFFTVKDEPAPRDARVDSIGDIFRSFYFNPRKFPDFGWVWVGKFCLQFGFTFFSTYQFYLLLDRIGFTAEEAGQQLALVGGISLLAMMTFAVAGGFLSDKLRRRKPFIYTAAGLIAAGLLTVAFASTFPVFVVGGVLLSAGTGAFTSVDLAMATDLLPEKDKAGKYMSIYYLASGFPGAIAPIAAPFILMIGGSDPNYVLLFVFGAMLALGASLSTWRIRGVR